MHCPPSRPRLACRACIPRAHVGFASAPGSDMALPCAERDEENDTEAECEDEQPMTEEELAEMEAMYAEQVAVISLLVVEGLTASIRSWCCD